MTEMMKEYRPTYALSSSDVGTFGGGMISGVRYFEGKVLVRIQELLAVEAFSLFCAATPKNACQHNFARETRLCAKGVTHHNEPRR
jgi:hypothetical protein